MKQTVLIVEDETPYARALKLKLEKKEYKVLTAENGEVALDALKENDVQLIMLDLVLPVMDGFEFLEKIRKEENETSVIIFSNLRQEEDKDRISEYGISDYVEKSEETISNVVKKIEHVLETNNQK